MTKGDRTRERIVAQSAALMNSKGYVGTSVAEILAVTGLQKGGIYNHFKSRDEVAAAAFEHAVELALGFMLEIERGSGSAGERLLALISAYRDYGARFPLPGGCPLIRGAVEGSNGPEWIRDRARTAMNRMTRIFERLIAEGRGDGSVNLEANPERLALAIVAALEGAVMLGNLHKSSLPAQAALDMVESHIKTVLLR
jgi:AcrR family transcriptional regulator